MDDRTTWDDDSVRVLRELWAEGLSIAEIGKRMGRTKNAVVGKAHRMCLPPRPSPVKYRSAPEPEMKPIVEAPIEHAAVGCFWPFGYPGEDGFHFCGAEKALGRSYCAEHLAIAYVPRKKTTPPVKSAAA
jgi:GcrA cell cycle regulator